MPAFYPYLAAGQKPQPETTVPADNSALSITSGLLVFLTAGPRHVLNRIGRAAMFQHFKMHMGPGRPAGAAHQRNHLGFLDQITHFYTHGSGMGVASNQTIAMGDFHQVAIAATLASPSNNARGHRNNVTAVFA